MPTPGVTITFTLTDDANNPVQGKVVFTLCGFGNQIPRITGTSILAKLVYEADANSSGVGSATLWGNYQITPGTFYSIAVYPGNNAHNVTSVSEYLLLATGTFDLSTLIPISPSSFNPTPAPSPGGAGKPGGNANDVQINVNGNFYGDGGFTYIPSSKAVAVAGSVFVGPADSSFSSFAGGAPAYFGCSQAETTSRFGTVNSGIYDTLSVICQDDFTVNPTNAPTAGNFQTWTTNTTTNTQNADVFPSVITGIVASAHHIGTGDLAGTNNGPVGAFISATNETAAHISAVTGTVIDIGNSGGGIIDQATSIWIPSIGDPGSTITTARGLYVAPQIAGAGTTYAIYVDGTTESYFGGNIVVPGAIANTGSVFITPSVITFAAPSVGAEGATGATSYTYTVNALRSGVVIAQSAPATITNGNATLSGSNYNMVSWSAVPQADHYIVNEGIGNIASAPITALALNDTGAFTAYSLSSQNGFLYTPNGALIGSTLPAMLAVSPELLYDSVNQAGVLYVTAAGTIPAQNFNSSGIIVSVYDTQQTQFVSGVNVGVTSTNPTTGTAAYYSESSASNTTGTPNVYGVYANVYAGIANGSAAEITNFYGIGANEGIGTVALATNLHCNGVFNSGGGAITEVAAIKIEDVSGIGTASYGIHIANQTNSSLGSASWAIKVDGGVSEFGGPVTLDAKLIDSLSSAGTSGQVLSSTGSAVKWIAAPSTVNISGTPVSSQVAIWTNSNTIEGLSNFTFNPAASPALFIGTSAGGGPNLWFHNTTDASTAGFYFNNYPNSYSFYAVDPSGNEDRILFRQSPAGMYLIPYQGTVNIQDGGSNSFAGVQFINSNGHSAEIGISTASYTAHPLVLPTATGSSGQVLTTNGANPQQLSWTTVSIGSGTVNSGTKNYLAYYAANGTAVSEDILLEDNGTTLGYGGAGGIEIVEVAVFSWKSAAGSPPSGAVDTGLSRDSAGVIDVGNGTQGDKSGTINATNANFTGTCLVSSGTESGTPIRNASSLYFTNPNAGVSVHNNVSPSLGFSANGWTGSTSVTQSVYFELTANDSGSTSTLSLQQDSGSFNTTFNCSLPVVFGNTVGLSASDFYDSTGSAGGSGQVLTVSASTGFPVWETPSTVNSGTAHQIAYYSATGTAVSGDSLLTDSGTVLAYTGTGGIASSGTISIPATSFIKLDTAASFWRLVQTATGSSGNFRISQDGIIDAVTVLNNTGFVGINKTSPNSQLAVVGLPVFANNAAAVSGGLTAGDFYRTGADPDPVCVVH